MQKIVYLFQKSKRGSKVTSLKNLRIKKINVNDKFIKFQIQKNIDKKEKYFKKYFGNPGVLSSIAEQRFSCKKNLGSSNSYSINDLNENNKKENLLPDTRRERKKTNITSFLLILALSIHACFEGIALGLQESRRELFYMLLAISMHKWVEALSIGINLSKALIDKLIVLQLLIAFSLMTPVGIILGIFLTGISPFIQATFLSISAGTFIYIAASEIVIEEFSISQYKVQKFFAYLFGAILIGLLTLLEE